MEDRSEYYVILILMVGGIYYSVKMGDSRAIIYINVDQIVIPISKDHKH